jgi:hypothetical protein
MPSSADGTLSERRGRAPYFHSGAAANLNRLVSFCKQGFQMNLTAAQQADLVPFLNTL